LAEVARKKLLPSPPGAFACEAARGEGAGRDAKILYAPAMSEQAFVEARLADILGAAARDYPAVLARALDRRPAC
jgi:hypothetical protein